MTNSADQLRFGRLTLNLRGFSVSVDGKDVPLTHGEFVLLAALARDPYSVLGRAALAEELKLNSFGRKAMGTNMRAVDTHVARMRRKLLSVGCDCIHTMRNVGYRFVPPSGP